MRKISKHIQTLYKNFIEFLVDLPFASVCCAIFRRLDSFFFRTSSSFTFAHHQTCSKKVAPFCPANLRKRTRKARFHNSTLVKHIGVLPIPHQAHVPLKTPQQLGRPWAQHPHLLQAVSGILDIDGLRKHMGMKSHNKTII